MAPCGLTRRRESLSASAITAWTSGVRSSSILSMSRLLMSIKGHQAMTIHVEPVQPLKRQVKDRTGVDLDVFFGAAVAFEGIAVLLCLGLLTRG